MERLREHVDRGSQLECVSDFVEESRVAGEAGWITGDVNQSSWLCCRDRVDTVKSKTFARGIGDHNVPIFVDVLDGVLGGPSENAELIDTGAVEIGVEVGCGPFIHLDGDDSRRIPPYCRCKQSYSCVRVEQGVRRLDGRSLGDQLHQGLCPCGVVLEKGTAADPEWDTCDRLLEHRIAVYWTDRAVGLDCRDPAAPCRCLCRNRTFDDHEVVSGCRRGAQRDCVDPRQITEVDEEGDEVRVEYRAFVQWHPLFASPPVQRGPALDDSIVHTISVAEWACRSDGGSYRWIGMATEVSELAGDDRLFPFQLGRVVAVLPLTATAAGEVGAPGVGPCRGGLIDRLEPDPAPGALVHFDDPGDLFVGQRSVDEERLTVELGHCRTAVSHVDGVDPNLSSHRCVSGVWSLVVRHVPARVQTTLTRMRAFHESWFWVAVLTTGLVGLWGFVLGVAKRPAPPLFEYAKWVAVVAMGIQVAAGLTLYAQGWRPQNDFHIFYGIVIVFTFSFAYIYRTQMARRPELSYGLLLLFVMGLGLRAWSNVH